MIDWDPLYDAIYGLMGVSATLAGASITAIDETRGVDVSNDPIVQTVKPAARVRMSDLTANNLTTADLKDSGLTINGREWRVKSFVELPNKSGDSQVRLILLSES